MRREITRALNHEYHLQDRIAFFSNGYFYFSKGRLITSALVPLYQTFLGLWRGHSRSRGIAGMEKD